MYVYVLPFRRSLSNFFNLPSADSSRENSVDLVLLQSGFLIFGALLRTSNVSHRCQARRSQVHLQLLVWSATRPASVLVFWREPFITFFSAAWRFIDGVLGNLFGLVQSALIIIGLIVVRIAVLRVVLWSRIKILTILRPKVLVQRLVESALAVLNSVEIGVCSLVFWIRLRIIIVFVSKQRSIAPLSEQNILIQLLTIICHSCRQSLSRYLDLLTPIIWVNHPELRRLL